LKFSMAAVAAQELEKNKKWKALSGVECSCRLCSDL
jgi:hypothetical protein